jgi:AcrR family transcriptional regulator
MFTWPMSPQPKRHARAPHQLPPGRHKLSRAFVEANQRDRILDAVVDVTSLAGYAAMSVEDIITTAGVSRRTFYDSFKSKEDAFVAALDEVAAQLIERVRAASDSNQAFADGVRDCLAAFLQFLANEPRHADLLIVEVLAAGPEAIERRNDALRRFAELLRAGAETVPNRRHPPDLTAETIIGGIYEVVYSRVLQGRAGELPALLPDLAYSMLQPYIGHEAAKREAAKPPSLALGEAVSD